MHRFEEASPTMTHAPAWSLPATGEAPSSRGSAVGLGPDPLGRRPSGRGGREFGVSLVARLPAEGFPRAGGQADAGTTAAAVQGTETPTRDVAWPGRAPCWLPDGALDAAAGGRSDSPGVRGALSPGACLEGADGARLELSEAGAPRRRAGRGRHRPVEARGVAADKKTPLDVAPISCSSMRAGSCSSPTSVGRGHPKGRPPACATATATIASRCAVVWRSRPSDGA